MNTPTPTNQSEIGATIADRTAAIGNRDAGRVALHQARDVKVASLAPPLTGIHHHDRYGGKES